MAPSRRHWANAAWNDRHAELLNCVEGVVCQSLQLVHGHAIAAKPTPTLLVVTPLRRRAGHTMLHEEIDPISPQHNTVSRVVSTVYAVSVQLRRQQRHQLRPSEAVERKRDAHATSQFRMKRLTARDGQQTKQDRGVARQDTDAQEVPAHQTRGVRASCLTVEDIGQGDE